MKKIIILTLIAMMTSLSASSLSFAEDMKGMGGDSSSQQNQAMMGRGMMGKGMMGGKMMGMHMMMKMMMEKSVVATSDGGVVVVAGNKITKYDKDLKVVKEAEVKMDMEAMGKNMEEMMAKCPMMQKMKEKEQPGETESVPTDHEKHH